MKYDLLIRRCPLAGHWTVASLPLAIWRYLSSYAGCSDLSSYPSVDQAVFANVSGAACDGGVWTDEAVANQVFKQASCVPDEQGNCPTSIKISDKVEKIFL